MAISIDQAYSHCQRANSVVFSYLPLIGARQVTAGPLSTASQSISSHWASSFSTSPQRK